ncbi:MAG TPA: hypothetical protein VLF59_03480 [Candidatus Saccharimonadales bacterium]|nr:hypothetical protein [Candidatus Saccharimonadales bacterium]
MENQSPFLAMKRAETQIKALLRGVDMDLLTPDERKAMASLRRLSADARLDIRDYELSETREEQLGKAHDAHKVLTKLKTTLLAVSTAFGPADIAHLDAQLEQIKEGVY